MINEYKIEPISRHIGATITGVDLQNLTPAATDFINQSIAKHLVVFFRDQKLDPDALHKLAKHFGKPVPYPFVNGLPGFPEIVEVKKLPHETANFGGVWHSDTAYLEEPTMGAMLYAVQVPEQGGDTLFANMYLVFEQLSIGMRKLLSGLVGVNDADKPEIVATRVDRQSQLKKGLKAEHPVIRTHPVTGRQLVYVNRAHTTHFVGMTELESSPILAHLFELTIRPENTCRFHWQPGSLAFWDNRACQHYPLNDYNGEFRHMLRISLAGDKPY